MAKCNSLLQSALKTNTEISHPLFVLINAILMQTQGRQIKFHLLDEGEPRCHFNIIKNSYLTFLKTFSHDA